MRKLPKDRRGYPIPYTVLIDDKGLPHFAINEEGRRQRVIKKHLCPICGNKLLKRRASVGGPLSAFHPQGSYIDPPMHVECARYALAVCPYLAAPSYSKRLDAKTIKKDSFNDPRQVLLAVDPTMDPNRPQLFVMVTHTHEVYVKVSTGVIKYVVPVKPYFAVEYWRQGARLPDDVGEAEAKQVLLAQLKNDVDNEE